MIGGFDGSGTSEHRRYVTMDVFTQRVFGGNPLAVVLDARGLTTAQMQSIATEFNYSETTFLLPPRDPRHTAHVRIFTSRTEVPFAGHPNVGTAVALAHELQARGVPPVDEFIFEEAAGLVPVRLIREGGSVVGAEFRAPESLSVRAEVSVADAARCLSLSPAEISTLVHPPRVVSVGLAFLVAEVVSLQALGRARPDVQAHQQVLPPAGTDAVFAYQRDRNATSLRARMFAPLDATVEDPATGSASAATLAWLAQLAAGDGEVAWRIDQGVEMGRPSLILGRTIRQPGNPVAVHIGGQAVHVMQGTVHVPNASP